MWIVRLALRRPYTFIVMSMLILILGGLAIYRTPVDIFPVVDIPVIAVIWNFNGMEPTELEGRIVSNSERAYTTTVSNIEHMESETYNGVAVIKIYFQPGADIPSAIAETAAVSQSVLRTFPAGTTPSSISIFSPQSWANCFQPSASHLHPFSKGSRSDSGQTTKGSREVALAGES